MMDIGADMHVKLQDGSAVGVHKFMLQTHAPHFFTYLKSKKENIDMKPDTFNIIKLYIYTGRWKSENDITTSVLLDLYYWSEKFKLKWLKWKSLQLLCSILQGDVTEFFLIFKYASENGLEMLEQLCLCQIDNYQLSDHQLNQLTPALLKKLDQVFVCFLMLTIHREKVNLKLLILILEVSQNMTFFET